MKLIKPDYKPFIERNLMIVNKQSQEIPFKLNPIQNRYITQDATGRDVILKARQQGFSSLILALFTADFLLKENNRSIIIADNADNARELLSRVKLFVKSYEEINKVKVPLKYDTKYELYLEKANNRYTIGTSRNITMGRSKTLNNLHLSEFAFYDHPEEILSGAVQAVVPDGRVIIETTANSYNFFKDFWEECKSGERSFIPLFYGARGFYTETFLKDKEKELGRQYKQEYPDTDIEAFISSGSNYFNVDGLKWHLTNVSQVMDEGVIYGF